MAAKSTEAKKTTATKKTTAKKAAVKKTAAASKSTAKKMTKKSTAKKARNLVIVESPTKVRPIKEFLGSNYEVIASKGHVRDLPKSKLGIDIANDFEPQYITIRGKGDLLKDMRKEAKAADTVYLATDPDREGEAISWHLITALNLPEGKYKRITFNEITKTAVKDSLKEPRDIDENLVDAQQARRVLDRIVGYEISPVLWAKVKRGLSAGRVQSVALRLICDREEEISAFIPKEYYTLAANLSFDGKKRPIAFNYLGKGADPDGLLTRAETDAVMAACKGKPFSIDSVKEGSRTKNPPLPFTTSTMQQSAVKSLNFSVSRTMRVAQQLYEGVPIKGRGTVGLITYLRTDSTRVSDVAKAAAADFISAHYGDDYLNERASAVKGGKNIQDAHEAIRPADPSLLPSEVKDQVSRDQYRLYQLIWNRFMASRMAPSRYDTMSVKVKNGDHLFSASGSRMAFEGWELVYRAAKKKEDEEEETDNNEAVFSVKESSKVNFQGFDEKQHYTEPPAHFTEASLVHSMEELGIGRPSTYSPTITTLQKRHYITKEQRALFVTELGEVVNSIMKESFPEIVDLSFTANLESMLDSIEEGSNDWKSIIRNFFPDFEAEVKKADEDLEKVKIEDEVTDIKCDKCGRNMVIKFGPHGKFLACPGFPECRNTKPLLIKIGVACPKCGKDIVERKTKKGRRFYGCEDYPTCDFMSWNRPVARKCPKCGSYMVQKGNRIVCSDASCGYSEAKTEEESDD